MDHVARFKGLIGEMRLDGRYRTFIAGAFPTALWHAPDGQGSGRS
ncbi:MAG: 5-aminolevulinate synthase [Hyphomicrobiales bacterium]|nr:5-aminolevulinate synthase [Hyphomicrobiales bacterium]